MYKLASFQDPALANALDERLAAANIPTVVRGHDGHGGSDDAAPNARTVWIVSEQDLQKAQQLLRTFLAQTAIAGRRGQSSQPIPYRQRILLFVQQAPVTSLLFLVCLLVAFYTDLGANRPRVELFTISRMPTEAATSWSPWDALRAGELWRVFTPALLHFHPFHVLFNVFWLRDLGGPTERVQGSWQYVGFMLWSAAVSNLAELAFGHSQMFGGMSGVVYALMGYLWARGTADPASGIRLPRSWVLFFVGWMALGFTGLLDGLLGGGIANYCHLGGFAAGALYGYIAALFATKLARS
ncbi:MAG: rhomboid family intramembrane serine protease [Polyangiales bacterium]